MSAALPEDLPAGPQGVVQVVAQVGDPVGEADHLGLILMAKAGYDPHTALELWRRFEQSGKDSPPEFLSTHPKVAWVVYPGRDGHPTKENADRVLSGGYGGVVVFGVKGGLDAGKKLIENVKLFSHLANVGDAKSLIIHPASTTHSQLSRDDLLRAGIGEDFVRLSVGIEDIEDIIEDLDRALEAV